jgi:hypothetical protein
VLLDCYRRRQPECLIFSTYAPSAACPDEICGRHSVSKANAGYPNIRVRPRVVVTTDGEIDDRCSMVRFLMYANDFQVERLVHSSSRFQCLGRPGRAWNGSMLNSASMPRSTTTSGRTPTATPFPKT